MGPKLTFINETVAPTAGLVFFDVDFTITLSGPAIQAVGYHAAIRAAMASRWIPARFRARPWRVFAAAVLRRREEIYDPQLYIDFPTRRLIE
jgi:hypothetical protein